MNLIRNLIANHTIRMRWQSYVVRRTCKAYLSQRLQSHRLLAISKDTIHADAYEYCHL